MLHKKPLLSRCPDAFRAPFHFRSRCCRWTRSWRWLCLENSQVRARSTTWFEAFAVSATMCLQDIRAIQRKLSPRQCRFCFYGCHFSIVLLHSVPKNFKHCLDPTHLGLCRTPSLRIHARRLWACSSSNILFFLAGDSLLKLHKSAAQICQF